MAAWILSCESTVDLPYRDMEQRNIPVLFYSYVVDGTAYLDDMGRNPAALPRFYQFLEEGERHHPPHSSIRSNTWISLSRCCSRAMFCISVSERG